jgi:GH24 family phage-related lysozyme (muramidase)
MITRQGIRNMCEVNLSDSQVTTLLSFATNVGVAPLANSKIMLHLNKRCVSHAEIELNKWKHKCGGAILGSLL